MAQPEFHQRLPRIVGCIVLALVTAACGEDDPADRPPPYFDWNASAGRPRGPNPHFSFFVTSSDGLLRLPSGPWGAAPTIDGFGGNLGGLTGADAICTHLAQEANPGDTKIWRAFLSTSGTVGPREDAIDRIGTGPWYDFRGFRLADDLAGLLPVTEDEGRPRGAQPELAAMFTVETGDRARGGPNVDNHDTLTGSDRVGRLYDDGQGGRIATCEDWTSSTVRGISGTGFGSGGQIPVGHSWPRSDVEGRHWISEHTINGCEPGIDIDGSAGAPRDDFRVGAAGGYGGFYCFALNAVPPDFASSAP